MRSADVCGANVGLEIRLRLVSAVDFGIERKPRREVMRERPSDVHVFVVRPQIEKLGKAPDSKQTIFCLFPGSIIS